MKIEPGLGTERVSLARKNAMRGPVAIDGFE